MPLTNSRKRKQNVRSSEASISARQFMSSAVTATSQTLALSVLNVRRPCAAAFLTWKSRSSRVVVSLGGRPFFEGGRSSLIDQPSQPRSEERRVGKEATSRWSPY